MKTSKIMLIHSITPREGPNGTLFFYDLEMENGDRGSIGKKTDNAFQPGQELNYTIEADPKKEGKFRIKEEKKEFKKQFGQRNYNAEFAMKALECAVLELRTRDLDVIKTADFYFDRLKKKSLSSNQSNND